MRQKVFFITLLVALLLCTAACAPAESDPAPSGGAVDVADGGSGPEGAAPTAGGPAAQVGEFRVETLDGQQVDQTVFSKAKLTMVNLWATWCGPCIRELPDLGELAEEAAAMDVQIIGIVHDAYDSRSGQVDEAQLEVARAVVERANVGFPVLIPDETLLGGWLKNVQGFPTTWFVDAQGNIVGDPVLGANSKDAWRATLQQKLAEVGG